MAEFRVELKGINRVRNQLRTVAKFHPEATNPIMREWTQEVAAHLRAKPYPPERAGQKYRRTGRLGRRWRAMNPRPGITQIINKARAPGGSEYASFVVGDHRGDNQAWMHVGRWWKARTEVDQYTPKLTEVLSKKLEQLLNG